MNDKVVTVIKTKTVTDESLPGRSVTIGLATYRMDLVRTFLTDQVRQMAKEKFKADGDRIATVFDVAASYGDNLVYPSCLAAVVAHTGFDTWPLTPDEFQDLPRQFAVDWEIATFELNPFWQAQVPEDAASKNEEKRSGTD
jgi:hypothetical protein